MNVSTAPVLLSDNRIIDTLYKITEDRQGENKKKVTKLKPDTKSETSLINLARGRDSGELVQARREAWNINDRSRKQLESAEQVQTRDK